MSHVSGRSQGIVRRASSPHAPSRPSSSPAKTIGTPGSVICSPIPTSCSPREPETVRKRAVSWLSSTFQECSSDCQGTPARNACIESAAARPSRRGSATCVLQKDVSSSSGSSPSTPQPPPDRPQEAGVVHRPVPAAAGQVTAEVVAVLRDEQVLGPEHGADRRSRLAMQVGVAIPPGHVRDVDPPAVEAGVEPAPRDRLHPLAQRRRAPVELRQRADAEPRDVPVRQRLVEEVELPLALEPLVLRAAVVQGQVADDPDAARVRGADERGERLVAAEKRVDPVERRRVVAVGAAGGEERGQVEQVGAEPLDVVEMRLDPGAGRRRRARTASSRPARAAGRPTRGGRPRRALRRRARWSRTGRGRSRRRPSRGAMPARRDRS